VTFSIAAHDPQSSPLEFIWDDGNAFGSFDGQADTSGSSQVVWTAPGTFTDPATITVTVYNNSGDPGGASTPYQFTVTPTGVQCPSCSKRHGDAKKHVVAFKALNH
jgi:hypothetical protein